MVMTNRNNPSARVQNLSVYVFIAYCVLLTNIRNSCIHTHYTVQLFLFTVYLAEMLKNLYNVLQNNIIPFTSNILKQT